MTKNPTKIYISYSLDELKPDVNLNLIQLGLLHTSYIDLNITITHVPLHFIKQPSQHRFARHNNYDRQITYYINISILQDFLSQ